VSYDGINRTDQSKMAISNATEDIGVEGTNLLSEEKTLSSSIIQTIIILNPIMVVAQVETNRGKNYSTPGFGLLGSLTCLCGGWKIRKK